MSVLLWHAEAPLPAAPQEPSRERPAVVHPNSNIEEKQVCSLPVPDSVVLHAVSSCNGAQGRQKVHDALLVFLIRRHESTPMRLWAAMLHERGDKVSGAVRAGASAKARQGPSAGGPAERQE